MRLSFFLLVFVFAGFAAGCGNQKTPAADGTDKGSGQEAPVGGDKGTAEPKSAKLAAGAVPLSPENTKIEFVGTKPEGKHVGGFKQFTGKIEADSGSGAVKSIAVDIDTESLWSDNPKLTDHLKAPDFFNVQQFPKAKFESTKVARADGGKEDVYTVTGNLTLHGVTKEISFPATILVGDEIKLDSTFEFDRTEFGMDYGRGKIADDVQVKVKVGQ